MNLPPFVIRLKSRQWTTMIDTDKSQERKNEERSEKRKRQTTNMQNGKEESMGERRNVVGEKWKSKNPCTRYSHTPKVTGEKREDAKREKRWKNSLTQTLYKNIHFVEHTETFTAFRSRSCWTRSVLSFFPMSLSCYCILFSTRAKPSIDLYDLHRNGERKEIE